MDISILSDLGFSPAEIKIYISLLELGTSKAGAIIRQTRLQNSVVHLTLSKMVDKGLVAFFKKGQVKYYDACDPRSLIRTIEEKKTRFEAILPQLLAKQETQERNEAEVFEGIQGLKAMLYQAIEDGVPGDEYLFFAFITNNQQYNDEVFKFYQQFQIERDQRGLVVKGIAPDGSREIFKRNMRDTRNVLFVNFPTLQNISVFRNRVMMTPWEERPVSFLITSRQLADSFRNYFFSIWRQFRKA